MWLITKRNRKIEIEAKEINRIGDYSKYLRRNHDSIQEREGMQCVIAYWVNEQCEDLIVWW